MLNLSTRHTRIRRVLAHEALEADDQVAVEEPLEIRIGHGPASDRRVTSLAVTMRTPGSDAELACGFLLTEGILRARAEIEAIGPCGSGPNVLRVELTPGVELDVARLTRHFYATSSCGVCGKASLEAIRTQLPGPAPAGLPLITARALLAIPHELRRAQRVFETTGGLHASALFTASGRLLALREDVGRHNALDKLLGAALLAGHLPLRDRVLLVSGRASFELVQKAAMAGLPLLAAVGAPSSLAIDLAREAQLTLIGFLREGRFNIYSGAERVLP